MSVSDNKKLVEAEVNATIKLVMTAMEELAAKDPSEAAKPTEFNELRNAVIRKIWNLSRECIRYGVSTVQPS